MALQLSDVGVSVQHLRWRRRIAAGFATLATLALAALGPLREIAGPNPAFAGVAALASLTLVIALWKLGRPRGRWRRRPGAVRIEDGRLDVELGLRSRRHALAEVVAGWREVTGDAERVVLQLRRGAEITVGPLSRADGDALLDAAGVDVKARALVFDLEPPQRTRGGWVVLATAFFWAPALVAVSHVVLDYLVGSAFENAGLTLPASMLGPMAVLSLWVLARSQWRARVSVGSDGVHLRRLLRRAVFAPIDEVRAGLVEKDLVRLTLRSARGLSPPRTAELLVEPEQAAALVRRVEEARARLRPDEALDLRALDRKGEPAATFIASVARLLSGGGYRDRVLAASDLLEVVEDARAPAGRRVAAAAALVPVADVALRERLRIAAETSANPPLRIALEATLAGALDAEAYELAEAEEQRRA